MFIDANLITVLIEKYEELMRNGQIYIHPNAIIKDLEGLVDAEAARMEKMAADWADQEDGRLVMEDAHHRKVIEQDMARFDWPGGV